MVRGFAQLIFPKAIHVQKMALFCCDTTADLPRILPKFHF